MGAVISTSRETKGNSSNGAIGGRQGGTEEAQPPTGGTQDGSSVGMRTRRMHFFFARFGPRLACSVGCLLTRFLRRSAVRSLLRVCCLVGREEREGGEGRGKNFDFSSTAAVSTE